MSGQVREAILLKGEVVSEFRSGATAPIAFWLLLLRQGPGYPDKGAFAFAFQENPETAFIDLVVVMLGCKVILRQANSLSALITSSMSSNNVKQRFRSPRSALVSPLFVSVFGSGKSSSGVRGGGERGGGAPPGARLLGGAVPVRGRCTAKLSRRVANVYCA